MAGVFEVRLQREGHLVPGAVGSLASYLAGFGSIAPWRREVAVLRGVPPSRLCFSILWMFQSRVSFYLPVHFWLVPSLLHARLLWMTCAGPCVKALLGAPAVCSLMTGVAHPHVCSLAVRYLSWAVPSDLWFLTCVSRILGGVCAGLCLGVRPARTPSCACIFILSVVFTDRRV